MALSERGRIEQPSFGENLRREREMRGISLEEISASTKISVRFLEALESDDFGNLPGGIFTRGFIRSYAKYLGLDEDHVIGEYQLLVQPNSEVEVSRVALGRIGTSRPTKRSPAVPLLVAVLLLIGGYGLFRYAHRTAEPTAFSTPVPVAVTPPATTDGAPASASSSITSTPNQTSASAPTGESVQAGANPATEAGAPSSRNSEGQASPATVPSAVDRNPTGVPGTANRNVAQATTPATEPGYPVLGQGNLTLQVAVTEPAWINVEADGKTELQRTLQPHEVHTVRAKDHFDLVTGNASALVLTLNGETLKPLGKRGEVKKVHLTADDAKPSSPSNP